MAEAIVYCDRCGRLVPPGDLERGVALRTPSAALCVSCTAALEPAERAAIERAAAKALQEAGAPVSARRTPTPRPSFRQVRAQVPRSAPRAGLILGFGGGFGLALGAVLAIAFLGTGPTSERTQAPPAAGLLPGATPALPGAVPGPGGPSGRATPSAGAGGEGLSAPGAQRPVSAELEAIWSMLDQSFSRYDEVAGALRDLIERNRSPAEVDEAKKRLAELESRYAALAEAELQNARKAAAELASKGRRSEAASVLRLVGARFAGSEWYRSRGGSEISSAIAEIEGASEAARAAASAGAAAVPLTAEGGRWDFTNGPEFPGASGSMEPGEPLRVRFDFSGGGTYVAAGKRLAEHREIERLEFSARGDPALVNVRFLDSTGQCLQYRLGEVGPEWREMRIRVSDPPEGAWGGANDKKVHQPVREIWLCVEKRVLGSKGAVEFRDLRTWRPTAEPRVLFDVTFDADDPDARPRVADFDPAGANRVPTGFAASETETVTVRRSSGGLASRPVELASKDNGNRSPQLLFEFDRPVSSGVVRMSWESAFVSYSRRTDGGGTVETALTFRLRNKNTDPIALVSYVHDSPDGTGGLFGIDCVAPNPQWATPRHEARWKAGGPPDRFDVLLDLDALYARVWRNGQVLVERAGILKERVLDGLKGLEITDGWAVGGGNGSFVAAVDNVKIALGGEGPLSAAFQTPAAARAPASAAALDSDPALAAWWKLDDRPGSAVAADSSGKGLAGTLTNMDLASSWVAGKLGGGLSFDGADDYVSAGGMDFLDGAKELTVAAWVKTSDLSKDGTILARGGWNAQEKVLFFRDDVGASSGRTDTFKISVKAGGVEASIEGRSGACADSGWHHVAFTFAGGSATGLRLYVDGVEDPNGPASTARLPRLGRTGLPIQLGRADANPLKGVLDDVRIYTRALAAEEIAALYASAGGKSREPARLSTALDSDPALVGWWKLDEAAGLSAQDSSGKGNVGTLVNCSPPLWSPAGGRLGGALGFDGFDDRVNCGASASLATASVTVAFWMKANALANQSPVDKLPTGDGCGWSVRLRGNGAIWFRLGAEPGLAKDVYGSADPPEAYTLGAWVHVAATFDDVSKVMRLYVNGVKVAHEEKFDIALRASGTPLVIGNTNKFPAEPFNGLLDDVRVYSRALSGDEIAALCAGAGDGKGALAPSTRARPSGALDSDPALIGWWPLDDGPGSTTAADASKKIGSGKLTNMDPATDWVNGKVGGALEFDGSNDWVNCGNPPALAAISDLTVAAWVRPNDTSTHVHGDAIVSKEGGTKGFQLTWHWTGHAGRFSVMRDGASNLWGAADKSNGKWYHVAFVQSGGTTRLYVDGAEEASASGSISPNKELLTFGSHVGADRWLCGSIDDVRIYARALSSAEIAELHASADAQMLELAPTAEARTLLAKDLSASPASEGFSLNMGIILNLRGRFDRTKVAPRKLAAIGGAVAANLQFDGSLRGGLKTGEGYVFAGRLGLADSRLTLDAIRKGAVRALERERAELVRIVPDVVDIVRGRSAQAIRGDLEEIVNAILEAGAIPVLFTPALPKSTGDKRLDDLVAAVADAARGAARALNVPCLDAFALLNSDATAAKKYFAQGGALTRDGFELLGAKFLSLYRALERWVMGRGLPAPGEAAGEGPGASSPGARLVPNGGFEEVNEATRFAASWTAHQWGAAGAQYSVRLDRSNAHSGERALLVQATGDGALPGAFATLTAALAPGKYELRFWACADVGKTARVHANLASRDLGSFQVGEDWTRIACAIEVDERKPGAVLRVWTSTARVRVWFDDIELATVP